MLFLSDKKSLTSNQSLTLNPSLKERDLRTMAATPSPMERAGVRLLFMIYTTKTYLKNSIFAPLKI